MLKIFRKKDTSPEFEDTFNNIEMWNNLPDSLKKFSHLAQLYKIVANNMAMLKNKHLEEGFFIKSAFNTDTAVAYYTKQSKYYREKFYTSQINNPTGRFISLPDRNLEF